MTKAILILLAAFSDRSTSLAQTQPARAGLMRLE